MNKPYFSRSGSIFRDLSVWTRGLKFLVAHSYQYEFSVTCTPPHTHTHWHSEMQEMKVLARLQLCAVLSELSLLACVISISLSYVILFYLLNRMASYPNVRQTAEHEGDFSSDFISLHEPIESSTTANAVYPPVIPDGSRSSDNGPSRNRASGAPQEPYLYTHNSETYPPLGAFASGSSESVQSVGRTVQTVDGQRLTAGEDYYGFIRVTKTPIPGDENACVSNVLPTPALQFYENIPPPMEKFGKFIKHPERKRENARCQSFLGTSWTLKSPTPHDLAKAGMFYMGKFIRTISLCQCLQNKWALCLRPHLILKYETRL